MSFTATLAHYYKEVKPALMALPFAKAIDGYVCARSLPLPL